MRVPRLALTGGVLAVVLGASACGGSPAPTPSPSAIALRTVPACPATVAVPAEAVEAAPDASAPPTVVLSVGDAVRFPVVTGARVGVSGAADAGGDATLCAAPATTAGVTTYVAQTPGYLRVALQVGVEAPQRFYVRVTP